MRRVDLAPAQHRLSPLSNPSFEVNLLYDYGFWGRLCLPDEQNKGNIKSLGKKNAASWFSSCSASFQHFLKPMFQQENRL